MKSTKSMRSLKSVGSFRHNNFVDDYEVDFVFEECLQTTCAKFNCPHPVICKKQFQREVFKSLKSEAASKYKRISIGVPLVSRDRKKGEDVFPDSVETPAASDGAVDPDTVFVSALYDAMNRLAEIGVYKVRMVPRILVQVLGLLMPYFDQLTKLTIRKCGINVYTIYELSKIIQLTSLSDICLDDSPLPEGNYAILLEKPSGIKNLSLCRCRIIDEICKQIASHLHYLAPAEKSLVLLNLSSNHITDIGAKYLGDALRTNRRLRYLNLAGNRISDTGACYILNPLMDFALTYEETMQKRKMYVSYLRARMALFFKYLDECGNHSSQDVSTHSRKSEKKKRVPINMPKGNPRKEKPSILPLTEELLHNKADMMAREMMGPFYHPYGLSSVSTCDDWTYCNGNMVLCYLNLAYNDLACPCLKKIIDVLVYQANIKKLNETGLLRIVIEGNNLPQHCQELVTIAKFVNKSTARLAAKPDFASRRKSRATITTVTEIPIPKRSAK